MKPKIIILEGPDNIGKSTLAKELSKIYNARLIHFGAPVSKNKEEQYKEGKNLFFSVFGNYSQYIQNSINTVMDRSPFGEFVYCKHRGYNAREYYPQAQECIKELVKYIDVYLVIFYADVEAYNKFSIGPKNDEKIAYQMQAYAKDISYDFMNMSQKFANTGIFRTTFNTGAYHSLNERNDSVKMWLKEPW